MQQNTESKTIKVYIRLHNGNGCPIDISSHCKFDQLISTIHLCDLQLPTSYRVMFKGNHIKEYSATLKQLDIQDNSILHIEETSPSQLRHVSMDVCISYRDQLFVIKSTGNDLVAKLKQNIYRLTKIRPKDQILVFNGKKLEGDQTLNHYKICPNSLVCLLSTSQPLERSEILSDYENIVTSFIPKDDKLIESVTSLCEKRTSISKTTLFRSDSLDKKGLEQPTPVEVQIHETPMCEESNVSEIQLNFELFKSINIGNPLSLNVQNVAPLKHSFKFNAETGRENNEENFWTHIEEDIDQ